MSYSTTGLAAALAGVTSVGRYLSLHTGAPGDTGAAEAPAVTRLAADWETPDGAEVDSVEVEFRIPAAADGAPPRRFDHFGVWTAATGGTFVCGGELEEPEQFSANGGAYLFTATLTAAAAA